MRFLLNELIAREPWALESLRPFAGQTAVLCIGGMDTQFTISPTGGLNPAATDAVVNVRIEMSLAQLRQWGQTAIDHYVNDLQAARTPAADDVPSPSASLASPRPSAYVQGDAAFAQALSKVLENLRFDLEEALAPMLGGAIAWRVTHGLRQLTRRSAQAGLDWVTETAARLRRPEAVSQTAGPLLDRDTFQTWVDALRFERDRLERLTKRIGRLPVESATNAS